MDWAMEVSIKSTYLITWGANESLICWWNFPFIRLSEIYLYLFIINLFNWIIYEIIKKNWHVLPSYRQFWGSRWGLGREGRSARSRGAARRGPGPCPRRTWTRRAHCAPPAGHWTRRRPEMSSLEQEREEGELVREGFIKDKKIIVLIFFFFKMKPSMRHASTSRMLTSHFKYLLKAYFS